MLSFVAEVPRIWSQSERWVLFRGELKRIQRALMNACLITHKKAWKGPQPPVIDRWFSMFSFFIIFIQPLPAPLNLYEARPNLLRQYLWQLVLGQRSVPLRHDFTFPSISVIKERVFWNTCIKKKELVALMARDTTFMTATFALSLSLYVISFSLRQSALLCPATFDGDLLLCLNR